jgi:hypothetical protein
MTQKGSQYYVQANGGRKRQAERGNVEEQSDEEDSEAFEEDTGIRGVIDSDDDDGGASGLTQDCQWRRCVGSSSSSGGTLAGKDCRPKLRFSVSDLRVGLKVFAAWIRKEHERLGLGARNGPATCVSAPYTSTTRIGALPLCQ